VTHSDIQVEVDDPVAVIRLNRPDRLNAFTKPMLADIRSAIEAANDDPAVVGIVITGQGRGFCAGLDAGALKSATEAGSAGRAKANEDEIPGLFSYLLAIGKPVIAAVNGVAAGGGFVLAAMSDIRIASRDASFVSVFARRGLIAEHGTSWIVPRLVGAGKALDILWTSRRVDAEEAYRIGLVDYLVEPEELMARARAYVVDLAESVSPASIADTKRLVYCQLGLGYPEALRQSEEAVWAAIDRADAREGARALSEKRPPRFSRLGEGRA
jgi:enoyl-CoA hydratase/carnithine racemase